MSGACVDLLPASCRARLRATRSRRRWATLYASTAGAIVVSASALHVRELGLRAELRRLQAAAAVDADFARQAGEVRGRLREVIGGIERSQRLSWPVDLSDVLLVIGEVMPPSVSLTSLSVTPRSAKDASAGSEPAPAGLLLEISGVSPSDLEIAGLIAGLEAHPLFETVAIDHTRPTTVRGTEGRRFGLTCEVDFAALREARRASASSGAAPAAGVVTRAGEVP